MIKKINNIKEKYIGTTLIFATAFNNYWLAEKRSFIILNGSLNDIKKRSDFLGYLHEKDEKDMNLKYLGVYDNFNIYGTFSEGSVFGYSTYKSLKTVAKAKKLLAIKKDLDLTKYKFNPKFNEYIAQAVYFIKDATSFKYNRAIVANVVVKSKSKVTLYKNSIKLLTTKKMENAILNILSKNSLNIVENVNFLGFRSFQFIPEKLKLNSCFLISYKEYNNLYSIKKLISNVKEISEKQK